MTWSLSSKQIIFICTSFKWERIKRSRKRARDEQFLISIFLYCYWEKRPLELTVKLERVLEATVFVAWMCRHWAAGRRRELEGDRRPLMARSACSVLSQRISLQARAPWEEARHGPRSGPWRGGRAAPPRAVAGGKRGISGARRASSHQLELGLDQPPEKAGVRSPYESTEQFHRATDCVIKWINSSQRTL